MATENVYTKQEPPGIIPGGTALHITYGGYPPGRPPWLLDVLLTDIEPKCLVVNCYTFAILWDGELYAVISSVGSDISNLLAV